MSKRARKGPLDVPHIRRRVAQESAERNAASIRGGVGTLDDHRTWRAMELGLKAADLYYADRDMVALAVDASTDVPDERQVKIPSPQGFLLLGRALPPLTVKLELAKNCSAIEDAKPTILAWSQAGGSLYVQAYMHISQAEHVRRRLDISGVPYDEKAHICVMSCSLDEGTGHVLVGEDRLDVDETRYSAVRMSANQGQSEMIHRLTRWLTVAWQLMSEPRVSETRILDAATGGIAAAGDVTGPNAVRVVNVRPLAHKPTEPGEGDGGRVYSHRFIVRGHWRNQAVGTKRGERRLTWIPSHIKGPEGAPMKAAQTVWHWTPEK